MWNYLPVIGYRKQEFNRQTLLKYLMVSVCTVLLSTVFSKIYMLRNISIINWKELSLTIGKIFAEYLMDCWKKYNRRKWEIKKTENVYHWVTEQCKNSTWILICDMVPKYLCMEVITGVKWKYVWSGNMFGSPEILLHVKDQNFKLWDT